MRRGRTGAVPVGWLLWGTVAVVVGVIVYFAVSAPPKAKLPPVEEKPAVVRLVTIAPRRLDDVLRLPGRVRPLREAVLGVEQEGLIASRDVDEGDTVVSNQVLLRADTRLPEAALEQAEIELADAVRDLKRLRELRSTGAVSTAEYDAMQSREARANVARVDARTRLDQCTVRAPFGGVIDKRWVEAGEFAAKGRDAFHLVDMTGVKVRFAVPEHDVLCVRLGAVVPFTVAADPGLVHTGRVTFASAVADPDSNAFDVELTAANPDGRLRAGMIVDVALVRRTLDGARVVPLAAVVPRKGEHVVYVEQDGRAVRRTVQMDVLHGDEVVLSAGVALGERVVVEGQRTLQDGALLDVRGAESQPKQEP